MDTPHELQTGLGLATGLGLIQVGLDSSRWAGLNSFILWLSSCPYLRKGNISSHDAATESVSANSGADLDQFYCSCDPSPGEDLSYHVASPLQQDKWTKQR
ncbi:hypothetical protein Acr_00g0029040 [Actinidia rufa]|uniref:Uncharacterized protein n=1 Tax=Actinidia rufa TaxID=165716 RepID=A0A7J0DEI4_9ERIC|nr:hypothetical protein Acr_00g0029040 [Actinidia rufa]